MDEKNRYEELVAIVQDNNRLLKENNELLLEQVRREKRRLLFKVVWYGILIGLPLVAYYFIYNAIITSPSALQGIPGSEIGGVSTETLEQLLQLYSGQ